MILYFAYGSNMSEARMKNRGIIPLKKEIAFLDNYKFIINKKSYKNPIIGYANIIKNENSIVEGILYTINENNIKKLDKYEGYPKHYNRKILDFRLSNDEFVKGIVYIANPKWVSLHPLKTTLEYKNHILDGKEWISKNYYNFLNETILTDK